MADLLAAIFYDNAKNREIRDFIVDNDIVVDDETFEDGKVSVPFSYNEFSRFCNEMFAMHKDVMRRPSNNLVVVTDGTLEVSTLRGQGGAITFLQKASPESTI